MDAKRARTETSAGTAPDITPEIRAAVFASMTYEEIPAHLLVRIKFEHKLAKYAASIRKFTKETSGGAEKALLRQIFLARLGERVSLPPLGETSRGTYHEALVAAHEGQYDSALEILSWLKPVRETIRAFISDARSIFGIERTENMVFPDDVRKMVLRS